MSYYPLTLESFENLRAIDWNPGQIVSCDEGEDVIHIPDGFEWTRWTGVPTGNSEKDKELNDYLVSGKWTIVGVFDYTLLLQRPKYITYLGRRKKR